jgi:hypothetical protein
MEFPTLRDLRVGGREPPGVSAPVCAMGAASRRPANSSSSTEESAGRSSGAASSSLSNCKKTKVKPTWKSSRGKSTFFTTLKGSLISASTYDKVKENKGTYIFQKKGVRSGAAVVGGQRRGRTPSDAVRKLRPLIVPDLAIR